MLGPLGRALCLSGFPPDYGLCRGQGGGDPDPTHDASDLTGRRFIGSKYGAASRPPVAGYEVENTFFGPGFIPGLRRAYSQLGKVVLWGLSVQLSAKDQRH